MMAKQSFICSDPTPVKTNLFTSLRWLWICDGCLNPSKRALMKCTFKDMKGWTRGGDEE